MKRSTKRKLKNLLFQIPLAGYWAWSTFFFFHATREHNLFAFIMSALVGWFMTPFVIVVSIIDFLISIPINW